MIAISTCLPTAIAAGRRTARSTSGAVIAGAAEPTMRTRRPIFTSTAGIGSCARRRPQATVSASAGSCPAAIEILLHDRAECGFAVPAGSAEALAADGRVIGPARLRRARGLTYVVPVAGAFSYRLTRNPTMAADPARVAPVELRCERQEVRPGESVQVLGKQPHPLVIPAKAGDGDRLWFEFEGAWIDFTVRRDG